MPKKTEEKIEEKAEKSEPKSEEKKKLSQEEFEGKVLELAGKGLTSEKIGEALRREGIHPQEYKKKISEILKKEGKYVVPELKNTEEKLEKLGKHSEKNKQDKRALRDKNRIFAKLRRMRGYFGK